MIPACLELLSTLALAPIPNGAAPPQPGAPQGAPPPRQARRPGRPVASHPVGADPASYCFFLTSEQEGQGPP